MSLSPFSRVSLNKPASSSGGSAAPEAGKGFGRKFTFRVSFAGLLASGIILIIALGWVFAFGVIVGRGYDPEKKLPELARLLPPQKGADGQSEQDGQNASAEGQQESGPSILKPEDLTFMADLKQRGNGPTGQATGSTSGTSSGASHGNAAGASAGASVGAAAGTSGGSAGTKPNQASAASAAQRQATPAVAPAASEPSAASEKANDKKKYNFVFQTAAFKNANQADALRERLEGEGLRTKLSIEKDAKGKPRWYRVQVILRGSEADAAKTMQVLEGCGLKDARVISKNAVGRNR